MRGRAPGQALPLQFSAQLPQHELGGCSCALITHPPPWFWGTGLKTVLELLEMKLDPESSREQGLSTHGRERREGAGLGPAEPWGRGEGFA